MFLGDIGVLWSGRICHAITDKCCSYMYSKIAWLAIPEWHIRNTCIVHFILFSVIYLLYKMVSDVHRFECQFTCYYFCISILFLFAHSIFNKCFYLLNFIVCTLVLLFSLHKMHSLECHAIFLCRICHKVNTALLNVNIYILKAIIFYILS